MTDPIDPEDWLLDAGDAVALKRCRVGAEGLTSLERLVRCVWVADYGIRTAGDVAVAFDVAPGFLEEGRALARELGLPRAAAAFSLSPEALASSWGERFDALCAELRAAGARGLGDGGVSGP